MKSFLKKATERLGGHVYSRDSLPTGVNWLHDIQRGLALGPAPVCFDVGANVGQTVAALRGAFAEARIHAFEPFSAPRQALLRATAMDARVTVVATAMGSAAGSRRVQPHRESQMSSLTGHLQPADDRPAEIVEIDTIDRYCANAGIDFVDVLKTDTEGYDLEVLRGAGSLLAQQRIAYVYTEVGFLADDRQHTPFMSMFELMTGYPYRFLGLYETYPLHFFAESSVYCNALFVAVSVRERSLALRRAAG
ncbi:MAG: FkbM family methyltransferase [Chitinophagaceae bacterium]|nr:FkbM family methyltransferase [Rubrivivax sp.]